MSDVGKQIASAEIAREAVIEALHRSGALEDDQFKSSDVDEVLAAVWFAMDEVWPGSRFGSGAKRLEGTEPLTDEEIRAVLGATQVVGDDVLFPAPWADAVRSARAKLGARLSDRDG